MEIEDQEQDILLQPEAINTFISVKSVNGKTGNVVLTTSDIENTSDYQNGTQVEEAISTAIAGKQDTLTAGDGISIENNVISNTRDSAEWGKITGNITDQTDLQNALSAEATARENADIDLQSQIDAISVSSDVIDVVGSYAELQAYDTSHVKANDLIKVLQDETHGGAMSYYRWTIVDHVGSWVYVGSEGPFYTKSEIDSEFQNYYTQSEADTLLNNKMAKNNPVGTGKFEFNGSAIGIDSVSLGTNTLAWGDNSVAEGTADNDVFDVATQQDIIDAVNNGDSTNLLTKWSTDKFSVAGGTNSHTEGFNCLALGANSHAEGNGTIAENSSAHSEGTGSHASGKYSFAGGLETIASGQGSFAYGQRVKATGSGAIAMGYNETSFVDENAKGRRSIALGYNSVASGQESVAIGTGAWSTDSNRVAVGKYNENTSGSIFLVGNGGGPNTRSTAFYIDTNGRAYIKANLSGSENEKALVDLKYLRTYAQEYLPNQKVLSNSGEVNNAKDAGFYRVGFTYNLNGEYTYGEMLSIPYKSTTPGSTSQYGAQLFFANGDYDDGRQNCFWYRTLNGSTWNAWVKIDPSKYVTPTSYATSGTAGVVKVTSSNGVGVSSNGNLYLSAATETDVSNKTSVYKPIVPARLDYAVKVGVTTNTNTLTNTEKTNACSWLGTGKMVTLSQADYDALVSGGTVDANTYYFIEEE